MTSKHKTPRHKTPNYRQDRYGYWRPVLLRQTRKDLVAAERPAPVDPGMRRVYRRSPLAVAFLVAMAASCAALSR